MNGSIFFLLNWWASGWMMAFDPWLYIFFRSDFLITTLSSLGGSSKKYVMCTFSAFAIFSKDAMDGEPCPSSSCERKLAERLVFSPRSRSESLASSLSFLILLPRLIICAIMIFYAYSVLLSRWIFLAAIGR